MDEECDSEYEVMPEHSEFESKLSSDEKSYSYEDDDKIIADDFVLFITESVADDLIESVVDRLIAEKTPSTEQESDAEDFSHLTSEDEVEQIDDEIEVSESEKSLRDLADYLNAFVTEELILHASDKMTQITINKIIDHLLAFVTESVVADVIESVVKRVSSLVVGGKVEKITKFLTTYITNKEILNAVVKVTGVMMTHRVDSANGGVIGCPLQYLSSEYIQKYSNCNVDCSSDAEELWEPLTDQLTDSIADRIILDILKKLTEETTNHLTDYVVEYVLEDFLEEVFEELGESISKCSTRTYLTTSNLSEDITVMNEHISDAKVKENKEEEDEAEVWKDFSDTEYEQGLVDATVNQQSLFSYVHVVSNPCYVVNVPKRPALEHLMKEMIEKNLGASLRIKIGDRLFDCIPRLLKVYSLWFANLDWRIELCELSSADVCAPAFELIYKWMRHQTPIELQNVIKVLQGARHLKIDLLETDCWEILSQPHVREKLAFRLLMEAERMPMMDDIRDVLLGRVRNYFLALVGSDDFTSLKVNQLISLLTRDTIGVNSEAEVFFAALRWLSKSKQRLEHIKTVMNCVRFAYVPMPMLFGIRNMGMSKENVLEGSERVMQEFQRIPEMTKMLYDAMTYISLQFQNAVDGEPMNSNSQVPQKSIFPRRWVYHPKCPYHKVRLLYPYQHSLTQADFESYVASIQKDWLGDEPPENAVFDVEYDGVLHHSSNGDVSTP